MDAEAQFREFVADTVDAQVAEVLAEVRAGRRLTNKEVEAVLLQLQQDRSRLRLATATSGGEA